MTEKYDATEALLAERGSSWGDATKTHIRIAQAWSAILDTEVSALEVALCMAALKLVRCSINPDDPDSLDDLIGYGRIAQVIAGHEKQTWQDTIEAAVAAQAMWPGQGQ